MSREGRLDPTQVKTVKITLPLETAAGRQLLSTTSLFSLNICEFLMSFLFGPVLCISGGSVQEGLGTRRSHSLSSNAADGSAHSSSNMTSSSHVAKKSKTAQSKVGPTSSSPGKSKQTDNVGSDHPTPGTLTKAVTVFDIKMGKKDPLPDILTQLALPPVPSRIVHRSSNRIAEINSRDGNAKSGNSTTPMASKKKTPISRAVVEDDDHLMSKTEEEEEEEEELEGTDDDAATEDQDEDADWKPRTSIAIKEERLDQNTLHVITRNYLDNTF